MRVVKFCPHQCKKRLSQMALFTTSQNSNDNYSIYFFDTTHPIYLHVVILVTAQSASVVFIKKYMS
jgi:hypothetical protein